MTLIDTPVSPPRQTPIGEPTGTPVATGRGVASGPSAGHSAGHSAASPTARPIFSAPVKSRFQPAAPRKRTWRERVSVQMVAFIVVVAGVVGYPVYLYLDAAITGGIQDVGGGYKQVDLKAMSSYPLDQINGTLNDIPEKWRALDGQKVVMYGEMWQSMSAETGVAQFELCYSITKCCFSGPPQVQHFVRSRVDPGKSLNYYENLVKVTGVLHVHVIRDGGRLSSVYQLDVSNIEPVT